MEKIPENRGDELSQLDDQDQDLTRDEEVQDQDGTRDERFSDFSDPPRLVSLTKIPRLVPFTKNSNIHKNTKVIF